MTGSSSSNDLVAVFHCSFHPTQGNVIDWQSKLDETIDLDGVEFNALPSGLHVLDEDIIHFTKGPYHGICLFQRQKSDQERMRGYHLRSLGILVAQSPRPRPWRHVPMLREFMHQLSSESQDKWSPLETYFLRYKSPSIIVEEERADSLDEEYSDDIVLDYPASHINQIIRSFGPYFFTLYKYVLSGRRVLIYTQPPVEPACVLAQVIADLCLLPQRPLSPVTFTMGMVTLNDIDRLKSLAGQGWVACTTDQVFFDKTELYDMIINLSPKSQRPVVYVANHLKRWYEGSTVPRRPKLHHARFTWSDATSWNWLDKFVEQVPKEDGNEHADKVRWSDMWSVYNEACLLVAKYWLPSTGPQRGPSDSSRSFKDSVLSTFQWRTSFLISTLEQVTSDVQYPDSSTITLPPAVLSSFELGPLSSSDARFLEWLGERNGRKIEIRRTWKDVFCLTFGLQ